MTVVSSLPDRPLRRQEVDELGEHEAIQGIFPIYGEREELRDTTYGFVIVVSNTAKALAYDDSWKEVGDRELDSPADGVGFDEFHVVEELQGVITENI